MGYSAREGTFGLGGGERFGRTDAASPQQVNFIFLYMYFLFYGIGNLIFSYNSILYLYYIYCTKTTFAWKTREYKKNILKLALLCNIFHIYKITTISTAAIAKKEITRKLGRMWRTDCLTLCLIQGIV